ncbi:hypothetical protein PsAD2_00194 [Pseudovibrio axinellae]|uniref:Uncharacterized protein n=1 Tax=Pseudovibrio axinellae TaxID=989403 RepID=A0A166BDZ1_9HYPH|nr:hypothetical protein PsAD2_00194 [Pseudovibrio axinellae]SEQ52648.1 hypothetical protein SAMN05421798_1035 [Pseudovibrio axinellae]
MQPIVGFTYVFSNYCLARIQRYVGLVYPGSYCLALRLLGFRYALCEMTT